MNRQSTGAAWVPWVCVPFLLLLNSRYYAFEYLSIDLTLLQIPVAVALTYRYGLHGLLAALIGSSPLLISVFLGPMAIGGRSELYVIVVHAAWLTMTRGWLNPGNAVPVRAVSMVLLLTIGSISLDYSQGDNFGFSWWGIPVLYYAFFVLGLRNLQARRWLLIAGLLVSIGIILSLAERYEIEAFGYDIQRNLYLTDLISLGWVLDRPGDFLSLMLFFLIGKWLHKLTRTGRPSAEVLNSGLKLVLAGAILYLASPMWRGMVVAIANTEIYEDVLYAISPAGSFYILPLLVLCLAIIRPDGVRIAVLLVGAYYVLSGFADWNVDRSFSIDIGDFVVAIVFAMLGRRIARQSTAIDQAGVSWLPTPSAGGQASIELDEWKRQHDEISNTVRRVMLSLLAYALFCALTLAASNDASLFGAGSEIKLPIANTSIDYLAFLTVGPLILVGMILYLHLFLQSAIDLGKPGGAIPLPYIFNMDNPLAVILSGFLHYWLPVLLLFQFTWKAIPQPMAGFWLGLASAGMGIVMVYLHMTRISTERAGNPQWFSRLMFYGFGLLFAIQLASGGSVLKRPLLLDDAGFKGRDLSGVDFRGASLKDAELIEANLSRANLQDADLTDANLKGANLSRANLQDADLTDADFDGVDLREANLQFAVLTRVKFDRANLAKVDLRGVTGVECPHFDQALNFARAYRDEDLRCKATIPEPPVEKLELKGERPGTKGLLF